MQDRLDVLFVSRVGAKQRNEDSRKDECVEHALVVRARLHADYSGL